MTSSHPERPWSRTSLLFAALLASSPGAGGAQPALTPASEIVVQAKVALDNLQYDEAIRLCRQGFEISPLRLADEVALLQVMAAAWFPEGGARQVPDSAVAYLRRAIRRAPDVALPIDVKWHGLDSLFQVTRRSTFAAIARVQPENALTGTDGRAFVEAISTRPAAFTLASRPTRGGATVQHDSVSGVARVRLGLRAHDGDRALLQAGEYELLIAVRDLESGAVDSIRFDGLATGAPPLLDPLPALDSTALQPERSRRARATGVVSALFYGAATIALAQFAGLQAPERDRVVRDGRATSVGVFAMLGALAGGFLDHGRVLRDNVSTNLLTRAAHAKALSAAVEANRRRVADYRVELRIDPEARR